MIHDLVIPAWLIRTALAVLAGSLFAAGLMWPLIKQWLRERRIAARLKLLEEVRRTCAICRPPDMRDHARQLLKRMPALDKAFGITKHWPVRYEDYE